MMGKGIRIICGLSLVLLIGAGCVSADKYNALVKQYETDTRAYKEVADELSKRKNELEAQLEKCNLENKLLSSQLATQKEKYQEALKLNEQIKKDLEEFVKRNPGTEIGKDWQLIISDILFDSGKATLKENGKKALDDFVANVVKGKDLYLRIVGHTDSDPIVKTIGVWKTGLNHELAGARALTVLEYLSKQGISTAKMHYESYGENEPRAPNDTKENKAKNRRVEIYILEKAAESTQQK